MSRAVHPRSRLLSPIPEMRRTVSTVVILFTAYTVVAAAACPRGNVPCEGRQLCAPRGGACSEHMCVDDQGRTVACTQSQDMRDSFSTQKLPRALRHSTAAHAKPSRSLLQLAGVGNFLVGAKVAGFQRAINAAGAAAQLANFYGIEGLGLRHRMGALPAPGGLAVMALAGPAAMPGPTGFTVGWIGGTLEALAASANPLTVAATGAALNDLASSQGMGQLVGADGLSGLGLGTGLAASAGLQALNTEGLAGGGPLTAAGNLLQKMGLPVGGGSGSGNNGGDARQRKASGVAAGLQAMSKVLGGASNMASFAGNAIKGGQTEYTSPVTVERTVTYGTGGDSMLGGTPDLSSYNTAGSAPSSNVPYTGAASSGSVGGYYSNSGTGTGSVIYDTSMSSIPSGSFTTTTSSMPMSGSNSYMTSTSMPINSGSSYDSVGSAMTSNVYGSSSTGVPVSGSSSSSSMMGSSFGQSSQASIMNPALYQSYQSGIGQVPLSALG